MVFGSRGRSDIAKRAGVRGLIPFHFSARYRDRVDDLTREVGEDFRGEGFGGSTFRNV